MMVALIILKKLSKPLLKKILELSTLNKRTQKELLLEALGLAKQMANTFA